jgi:hypothetical protein
MYCSFVNGELSGEQVVRLNNEYFSVDPSEHFECRLWQLLAMPDFAPSNSYLEVDQSNALETEFRGLLHEIRFGPDLEDTERRRRATVIEAIALRHHVAETVLRLFKVLSDPACHCPWFHMADDKEQDSLSKLYRRILDQDPAGERLAKEVREVAFPSQVAEARMGPETNVEGFATAIEKWIIHAAWLLSEAGMDMGPAHNQVKHGLGIIPTENLRIDIVKEVVDPLHPTVEELSNGLPLINSASVQYLQRHRPNKGYEFGWSVRLENADPALALAEAYMEIITLRVLWRAAKVKYAPWLVEPEGEQIEYWEHPLPSDLMSRTKANLFRMEMPLIMPVQRMVPGRGSSDK